MNFVDLLNQNIKTSNISLDGSVVFPIGALSQEFSNIKMNDIVAHKNEIRFNLDLSGLESAEYQKIKIIPLSQKILDVLQQENFPDTITPASKEILFSTESQQNIYNFQEKINDIQVAHVSRATPIKILVVLITSSDFGLVNIFSFNKNEILQEGGVSDLEVSFDYESYNKDNYNELEFLRQTTYTSNLQYSYSAEQDFSALFAIDAVKLAKKYAKFSSLINTEDPVAFSDFLIKIDFYLLRYDKEKNGAYEFDRVYGPISPSAVNNLRVDNSSGKLFYNVEMGDISGLCDYQARLAFTFNDISIDLLKNKLESLKKAKMDNDAGKVVSVVSEIYGAAVPDQYQQRLNQANFLSKTSLCEVVDEVLRDLNDQLLAANTKSLADDSEASGYTHPYPAIPSTPFITYEETFISNINLAGRKANTIVNFDKDNIFKEIGSQNFISNIDVGTILEVLQKRFVKSNKFFAINKFSAISIKDESTEEDNLKSEINCGVSEEKVSDKIGLDTESSFLDLSFVKEKNIRFLYLDRVTDSVSGLIYEELNKDFVTSIGNNEKILVKVAAETDYFDSYFYVTGDNF